MKDTPTEKLYEGFIALLCGAKGLVEVNKLVRSDKGLQQAFGRERCAEQSVIQQTLDASTEENVKEMELVIAKIYRRHASLSSLSSKNRNTTRLDARQKQPYRRISIIISRPP